MTTTTLSTLSEGSRFLNAPTNLAGTRMPVTKAGCGEIKAHNRNGIVAGLKQLREDCHGDGHRILITYLPVRGSSSTLFQPQDSYFAERVLVMATFITRDYTNMEAKEQERRVLAQKWYLVEDMRPRPDLVAKVAMGLKNRARFGSVMEPLVAHAFNRFVLKPNARRRLPEHRGGSGTGIDLLWSELAGLYGELARELGNPFFAELAAELATYGETQAA
jgi:hypothetical protein